MIPKKLEKGCQIRVVAPARSRAIISEPVRALAKERFEALGLTLTFGKSVDVADPFLSSSVAERVADLHEAFADPAVDAIFTVIGGYNSNQLLAKIDYDLIQRNPKIFCGFSDITALSNAIFAKTGLITYSGPHYSSLGMKYGLEYTLEFLERALFKTEAFTVRASESWSNDLFWWRDQENRAFETNPGIAIIQSGCASGRLVGGNLGTLALLKGTPYIPPLEGSILFLEETGQVSASLFDRLLHSLIDLPEFQGVQGILFGRFEKESQIDLDTLQAIVLSKPELAHLPILAGLDFGHTTPLLTLPVGGMAQIDREQFLVLEH